MNLLPFFIDAVAGCNGAGISGQVYQLTFSDGTSRLATQAEILAATKAARIEQINGDCRARLTAYYGDALEQVSRASGIYGPTAQANHAAGVLATIEASNVARDAVNAASDIATVEAVTVVWPALT